jgi:hypothetical protein
MIAFEGDDVAGQLAFGAPDENGFRNWKPIRVPTHRSHLEEIYAELPGHFPPIFEQLLLSYRWAEVDLESHRLLANPPGPSLSGLLQQIKLDSGLWEALIPAGYIQFAKGPSVDYDPVCFDLSSRNKDGEYRVVKIDHEEILCNYRVKVVTEVAPSFEQLVLKTIHQAGPA